jgi:hypothetical protein
MNEKMKEILNKILDISKITLTIVFIIWAFYIGIPYRLSNPELTETQLGLKLWSLGFYDPLKPENKIKKEK